MLATNHLGHMRAIFYVFYVDFFLLLFLLMMVWFLCKCVWMIGQCAFFFLPLVVSYRPKYVFILLLLYGKYFCLNAYVMCRIDNKLWTKSLCVYRNQACVLYIKVVCIHVFLFKLFLLLFSL